MLETRRTPRAPAEYTNLRRKGERLMTRHLSLELSVLASLIATPCFAGSLHTTFILVTDGQTPYCVINNVDSKPIEVTASATSLAGSTRTPVLDNCPTPPSTLNAGAACFTSYASDATLSCHFTAKGKARASAQLFAAGDLIQVIPATAK
jgi:hypothetical protein